MEELTSKPWRLICPPEIDEFLFQGGWKRSGRVYRTDFKTLRHSLDGKSELNETTYDADGDDIRKLARELMTAERDAGFTAPYDPSSDSEWTREPCPLEDAGPYVADEDEDEDEDPQSEIARERRCGNAILDMLEGDLHACLPALAMLERLDQNIDAFEAFVRDMRSRFERGALPKSDILGESLRSKWRLCLIATLLACVAVTVAVIRTILSLSLAR